MVMEQPAFPSGVPGSGIPSRVRRFVQEHALYRQRGLLLADDSNYVAGIVTFIKEEFGIEVSSCEVTEENLGSLRAVGRFVASRQSVAAD